MKIAVFVRRHTCDAIRVRDRVVDWPVAPRNLADPLGIANLYRP
jgi:hypothetical protein